MAFVALGLSLRLVCRIPWDRHIYSHGDHSRKKLCSENLASAHLPVMSSLLRFLPTSRKEPDSPSPPPSEKLDAAAEKASIEKHPLGADGAELKTEIVDASEQDPDLNPGTLTFEEGGYTS